MVNPRVSITALIYRSTQYADWVMQGIRKHTPMVKAGYAEFYFIANDPTPELLNHLKAEKYPHYVQKNARRTIPDLALKGIAPPEYLHRVYCGWNRAIEEAKGELVLLVNSDNYFSPSWVENLLKHASPDRIVCSQLVERYHPNHGIFALAYFENCGCHPKDFNETKFLQFCDKYRRNALVPLGSYMPCMFYKEQALKAGLYPEGNLLGKQQGDEPRYGDQVFFERLRALGVQHFTAMDSMVYHTKEGEMDEEYSSTGRV